MPATCRARRARSRCWRSYRKQQAVPPAARRRRSWTFAGFRARRSSTAWQPTWASRPKELGRGLGGAARRSARSTSTRRPTLTRDRSVHAATWSGFRAADERAYEVPAALAARRCGPTRRRASAWLVRPPATQGFGGVLADEMGLGKSVQLITLLLARRRGGARRSAPTLDRVPRVRSCTTGSRSSSGSRPSSTCVPWRARNASACSRGARPSKAAGATCS